MVAGVLLALGSSGRPMVIEGFPTGEAILEVNKHLLKKEEPPLLSNIGEVITP